ncbi:PTS sugar transporter subunit IIA [Palleronia sp.]|uniref:PTS sugar transporter subunit IIA n=1 Tax=Palleronia sp. TaxID=1940284 RepID=UPI0035C828F9
MTLSQILTVEAVRTISAVSNKRRLFETLSQAAAQAYGLRTKTVYGALMDRESLGATGVGQGVALPHARLTTLEHVVGLFIRLERPLDYGSADRQPVDLIFGLFAPTDTGVEHLKAQARVSRMLRNPDLCAKLRANNDPPTLHAILTEPPNLK